MAKKKAPEAGEKLNRLKVVMTERGKTREEVAKRMKVSEATVSSWCQNHSQPHLSDLKKLAEFLGVDICALLYRG